MNRPTPETDAVAATVTDSSCGKFVSAEFSRRLEKQRNEARDGLEKVTGEAGLLRLERDQLLDALEAQACLTAYYNGHSDGYKPHPNGGLFWENYLCDKASEAIKSVKGTK